MSRMNHVPTYRKHKKSGLAIVTLPDGLGGRRDVLLGKHGTKDSRMAYARVIAEWETNGRRLSQSAASADITVTELLVRFLEHAKRHYRRTDGTATNELGDYRLTLRPLNYLYGPTAAKSFGPLALKAVRQLLVKGYDHPKHGPQRPLARRVINQRIGRIKRLFGWAVSNELVPPDALHGLQSVRGLERGRSDARETEPIKPVPAVFVEATLPFLLPAVAAMTRLQRVTGMRSGEAVVMRGCDLDLQGAVWLYKPGQHKTAWRGHQRVIPLGPRAQAILRPWLRLNLQEYLFQPVEAVERQLAKRKAERVTPMTPSQEKRRRKVRPRRKPHDRYTSAAYGRAITRGIDMANKARACDACRPLAPSERCERCQAAAIPHWHPHQIRHGKATELRRELGLDVARCVLGHRSPAVTEVYAELDTGKAVEAAARLG